MQSGGDTADFVRNDRGSCRVKGAAGRENQRDKDKDELYYQGSGDNR